jgi:signal transduction histidine kinase
MNDSNQLFFTTKDKTALLKKSIKYTNKASLLCEIRPSNINFLRIIECNDKFLQCFDLEKLDVIGNSYDFLLPQDGFDYRSIGYVEYLNLVKLAQKKQPADINVQIYYSKRVSKYGEFRVSMLPIEYKTKNIYCIINFIKSTRTINDDFKPSVLIRNLEKSLQNKRIARVASDIITFETDLREVFIQISKIIYQYLKADRCIVYKSHEAGPSLLVESCGEDCKKISDKYDYNNKQSMLGKYINFYSSRNNNCTIVNNDIKNSSQLKDMADLCSELKIGSQIVITMTIRDNVVGAIYIHQSLSRKWFLEEIELIKTIADQLAVSIDRTNYVKNLLISNHELIENSSILLKELKQEREIRELQNEFITLVSHEFKTPLQIIDGSRELIKRKIKSLNINEETIDKPLERIKNATYRMDSLIQNNLNLSKITAAETKIEVNKQDFDIRQLVIDIMEKSSDLINNKNISVEVDIKNLPNFYNGDQKLIDHSFSNIISNAIKYSNNNGAIKIGGGLKDGKLFFEVQDNGIGIPNQDLTKIGKKFFRATNTTLISGTGIGVYLTKYFIELHNGSLFIDSELDTGTTIKVLLPTILDN